MPPTTSLTRTLTRLRTLRSPFSTATKPDKPTPTSTHTTRKHNELDIQSHASKQAMREKEANEKNDTTTQESRGKRQDPKKDNPKAPEPVIGMQDENVGKVNQ